MLGTRISLISPRLLSTLALGTVLFSSGCAKLWIEGSTDESRVGESNNDSAGFQSTTPVDTTAQNDTAQIDSAPEAKSRTWSPNDMEPTAAGAVIGGALGAGVGVIVGSVSGSAGGGLAIGTAAGAATGALIGNQIEKGQVAREDQIERLNHQQEVIDQHRREIEDLKRNRIQNEASIKSQTRRGSLSSTSSAGSTSAKNSFNRPSVSMSGSKYRGSSRAKPFSLAAARENDSPRARLAAAAAPAKPKAHPIVSAKADTTELDHSDGIVEAPPVQNFSTLNGADSVKAELPKAELPPAKHEAIEHAARANPSANPAAAPVAAAPTTEVASATGNGFDCEQAREEGDRARRAVSDADRLFYYRRALKLCPSEPRYHLEIGQVYASIGRNEDAKFEFRQVLDLDPNNLDAHQELASLEKIH